MRETTRDSRENGDRVGRNRVGRRGFRQHGFRGPKIQAAPKVLPLRSQSSEGKFSVSRNRARTQVLLQAQKLHVNGSGTLGAFWSILLALPFGRLPRRDAAIRRDLPRATIATQLRFGNS